MELYKILDIIRLCYSECPRSSELYHDFAGFSLDEIVNNFGEKLDELPNYDFYAYEFNGELAGYFAITYDEIPFLYTFFIRPKFRNSEVGRNFWDNILEQIGDTTFMSGVFASNLPARKFLSRNGGVEHIINNVTYFVFERSEKCQ